MNSETRLFVGGIPSSASEDNLRKLFSKFGNVVSCDLKSKPSDQDNKFAFISLSADQKDVESCIHHFSQSEWLGSRLHVTRARESFLERLQKERQQLQAKKPSAVENPPQEEYDGKLKIKTPQINNFNIKKLDDVRANGYHSAKKEDKLHHKSTKIRNESTNQMENKSFGDEKKNSSDKKRLESMKKMRQQFNEKKLIIKTGLSSVDKASNKKIKFDDDAEEPHSEIVEDASQNNRAVKNLFDDSGDETGDDLDFQIKEQFEGKKGQKVLELQSRFKSDKRFTLDERFIEDEAEKQMDVEDEIQVPDEDEKARQLNILQNVLGFAIKSAHTQPQAIVDNKKARTKMGMLRFDPSQPDHAKFLAPKVAVQQETDTSTKRKKAKRKEEPVSEPGPVVEKVEVSKEQFYKVSDTLKEAIAQPNTFSLRSLFSKDQTQEDQEGKSQEQETGYTLLPAAKKEKVKNPFNTSTKNPFKYDSSDSEPEAEEKEEELAPEQVTTVDESLSKAVWKENLFFTKSDDRLKDGLVFFNSQGSGNKERRELKSLVKKRLYNRARKDTMFQKKIGGKRKNFGKNKKQNR